MLGPDDICLKELKKIKCEIAAHKKIWNLAYKSVTMGANYLASLEKNTGCSVLPLPRRK